MPIIRPIPQAMDGELVQFVSAALKDSGDATLQAAPVVLARDKGSMAPVGLFLTVRRLRSRGAGDPVERWNREAERTRLTRPEHADYYLQAYGDRSTEALVVVSIFLDGEAGRWEAETEDPTADPERVAWRLREAPGEVVDLSDIRGANEWEERAGLLLRIAYSVTAESDTREIQSVDLEIAAEGYGVAYEIEGA